MKYLYGVPKRMAIIAVKTETERCIAEENSDESKDEESEHHIPRELQRVPPDSRKVRASFPGRLLMSGIAMNAGKI
jgi:hypothetical protein